MTETNENSALAEVPHADLIAEAQKHVDDVLSAIPQGATREATARGEGADDRLRLLIRVLAALGDTVPCEQHAMMVRRGDGYKRAHDERTVERDALARVIGQLRSQLERSSYWHQKDALFRILDDAPAISPVQHEADVEWGTALLNNDGSTWDQCPHTGGEDAARAAEGPNEDGDAFVVPVWRYSQSEWRVPADRAAALREGTNL